MPRPAHGSTVGLRDKTPTFRIQLLAGVLVLLSVLLALPGSAAAAGDVRTEDRAPAKPAGLGVEAQPGTLEVGVSWDDVPGATSYSLNWRRPGGDFEPGDAVTVTETEATLAMPGRGLWRVRLQACNDAGCGPGRAREVALGQQPTLMGANGPAIGPAITLTGACTKITFTVQSSEALYVSTFLYKRSETGPTTSLGITNHDAGSTKVLDDLSAGDFILGIRVHDTGDVFWAGPGARNPDGLTHARTSGSTVSFEDWHGGGDEDFDDAVLLVAQANCDVSPPPQNTQNPPPEDTQDPPPEDTQDPPPEDTQDPPPEDTQDPPPDDTQDPPPEDTQNPPPDDSQNPPPQNTQNPPPQNTQNPPPEDTRTPPPENTQTPPLENAGTNPPGGSAGGSPGGSQGGTPGGIPGDGAEGTPGSTESEEPAPAEACGSSVLPVPPPSGWTYGASDTSDLAALMDAQRFPVASVWLFDIDAQEFRGHTVGAPDSLNTLDGSSLRSGSVVIMRRTDAPGGVSDAEASIAEDEPTHDEPTALPVPPPGGWTYGLACTSDLAALIAAQQFPVASVRVFDVGAQRFLSHTVGVPELVNTLDDSSLTPGSVVWMRRASEVPVTSSHVFYGSAAAGSGATIDGELVVDGTVIIAWDQDGEALLRAAVAGGDWVIDVSEGEAARVAFSIEGSEHSAPYDVVGGARTEVALAFGSPDIGDGAGDDADSGGPAEEDRRDDDAAADDDVAADDGDAAVADEDDAAAADEGDAAAEDEGDAVAADEDDAAADEGDAVAADEDDAVAADEDDAAAADEGDAAAADEGDAAAADDEAVPGPTALPNTGSGGLDRPSRAVLPLAVAAALTLGLAAIALVRRSRP